MEVVKTVLNSEKELTFHFSKSEREMASLALGNVFLETHSFA